MIDRLLAFLYHLHEPPVRYIDSLIIIWASATVYLADMYWLIWNQPFDDLLNWILAPLMIAGVAARWMFVMGRHAFWMMLSPGG